MFAEKAAPKSTGFELERSSWHVALVGMPSAAELLIARISAAQPKILLTIPLPRFVPNLVLFVHRTARVAVCADVPGLNEGASLRRQTVYQFLRHIERTAPVSYGRCYCAVVAMKRRDPVEDYHAINEELKATLQSSPIVSDCGKNKCDMPHGQKMLLRFPEKPLKRGW